MATAAATAIQAKRFMRKAEANVEELASKIERGEIRLPEMQRRYVWKKTRVVGLVVKT